MTTGSSGATTKRSEDDIEREITRLVAEADGVRRELDELQAAVSAIAVRAAHEARLRDRIDALRQELASTESVDLTGPEIQEMVMRAAAVTGDIDRSRLRPMLARRGVTDSQCERALTALVKAGRLERTNEVAETDTRGARPYVYRVVDDGVSDTQRRSG
jgi:hypothetical protein